MSGYSATWRRCLWHHGLFFCFQHTWICIGRQLLSLLLFAWHFNGQQTTVANLSFQERPHGLFASWCIITNSTVSLDVPLLCYIFSQQTGCQFSEPGRFHFQSNRPTSSPSSSSSTIQNADVWHNLVWFEVIHLDCDIANTAYWVWLECSKYSS